MPKEKKIKQLSIWPEDIPSGRFDFIIEVNKLISCGLWEETQHQVRHRFGEKCFLFYSRPKPGVKFSLAGKMWRNNSTQKHEDEIPF